MLHLHLQKLQEAQLVKSTLELSSDGKALNYFETTSFEMMVSPEEIALRSKDLEAAARSEEHEKER